MSGQTIALPSILGGRRPSEPFELDLRQNLAEPVANRALEFARVKGGRGPGEESRTKRYFDQEPRRLALVDHRFETRIILEQHCVTSFLERERRRGHGT